MQRVDELRRRAQESDTTGDWHQSAALYQQIADTGSATFWDAHNLARAVLQTGDLARAERLIDGLSPDGDTAAIAFSRASLLEQKGEHEAARAAWVEARRTGASAYWTRFGEARALLRLGQLFNARQTMAVALAGPDAESSGWQFAAFVDLKLLDSHSADEKFRRVGASAEDRARAYVDALPGMTYPEERRAVLAAIDSIPVNGQIVDLGCFIGSLTSAMALGLSRNLDRLGHNIHIHAFDNFQWFGPVMDQFWQEGFTGPRPRPGESFRHLFQQLTRRWSALIDIHEGDLLSQTWSMSIGMLSVDAMKSPALARHIVATFMPHLQRDGFVFHQDYCFEGCWWIPIYHYLLRDRFALVDNLPGATGMMFRVEAPITDEDVRLVLAHDLSDAAIADAAFALSLEMTSDPTNRRSIASAHLRYYEETVHDDSQTRIDALRARYAVL